MGQTIIGGRRANYAKALAIEWLRIARPDVLEACREEAIKKYPYSSGRSPNVKVELPTRLKEM
jgi:hypothetical protein